MVQSFLASCFTLLVSFLIVTRVAVAAEPAEIININYKYKIAFTDLTEKDVKPGDLVAVIMPDGKKVYLKVLEAYPVMVKLTVPDDAAHALTDDQFSAISVGSKVSTGDKMVAVALAAQAKSMKSALKAEGTKVGPGVSAMPVQAVKTDASAARPKPAVPTVRSKEPSVGEGATGVSVPLSEVPVVDAGPRAALLESRLDQMVANNVKLVNSITALIEEKNAAEAKAREKESLTIEAYQKADVLSEENAALRSRAQALGAKVTALEQDKAAQQQKIEGLNMKLDELKKKLAKTVEIINTNMKAYEKQ